MLQGSRVKVQQVRWDVERNEGEACGSKSRLREAQLFASFSGEAVMSTQ